jgi:hypothetical protein
MSCHSRQLPTGSATLPASAWLLLFRWPRSVEKMIIFTGEYRLQVVITRLVDRLEQVSSRLPIRPQVRTGSLSGAPLLAIAFHSLGGAHRRARFGIAGKVNGRGKGR